MTDICLTILVFWLGSSVGFILAMVIFFQKKSGTIHIMKDGKYDDTYIFLELNIPVNKLTDMDEVSFSVCKGQNTQD